MIEVIVALVVGIVVMGSVVQLLVVQGRGYRKQREQVDVRETVREAAGLLSWDLRQAAVAGSPFAGMGANSITIRSPRGLGIICGKHATLARYGLWKCGNHTRNGRRHGARVSDRPRRLEQAQDHGGWHARGDGCDRMCMAERAPS